MKKLTRRDIEQNTKMYDLYHNEYHMEDGWYAENKQFNFNALLKLADIAGVPLSGTSCLDVGSGTGDFSRKLRQRGVVRYIGIEVYEASWKKAKKKYPQEMFLLDDFLDVDLEGQFDYAFCSGALTVNLPDQNKYDYLKAVVNKMWQHSNIGVAFNVLTEDDLFAHSDLFFYSPKKVGQICRKIIGEAEMYIEPTPTVAQIHVYLYRLGTPQIL